MNKKKKLWSIYLFIPFGIAIIACFIINYAVDRSFTWSAIVAGGCFYTYFVLFALLFGGRHRILAAYIIICLIVIPYLYIIEIISNLYLAEPVLWVTRFGAPVSILWLAACGLIALIRKVTHANAFLMIGLSVLAFYVCERITNLKIDQLAGGPGESWRLSEQYPVIYLGTAAVFLFTGVTTAVIKQLKNSD